MKTHIKVTAYITCQSKLLVFRHVDYPEAGIQVPGGTVNGNEGLEVAALREAEEESGLRGLKITSYLGKKEYQTDHPELGRICEIRHYYHLTYPGPITKNRWRHWEISPSAGKDDKILFELYWVDFPDDIPNLSGYQNEMLDMIQE